MAQAPEKAPPLADNDTATMSGKVYNQLREAWERDRANAAPQMLESLENAEIALSQYGDSELLFDIRSAIAKAKGKQ